MIAYMLTFQKVVQFMIVPSTIFTIFLIYIVLTESPKYMQNYKYVTIAVCLSVYQFDFVDSVLLCRVNIYKTIGFQFYGYLSQQMRKLNTTGAQLDLPENKSLDPSFVPRDGFNLMQLYCISLIVMTVSLVLSFVWREFALLPVQLKPLNVVFQSIQFIPMITFFLLFFPFFERLRIKDYLMTEFLVRWRQGVYDPEYALFFISDWNIAEFTKFSFYALAAILAALCYSLKAIYRITNFLNNVCLSQRTIQMHKMFLRSLIIQFLAPVALFIVPLAIAILLGYLNYLFKFFPMEDVNQPAAQVGAFLVTIPSFFSTIHVIVVIYFTAPYRNCVKNLMGLSQSFPLLVRQSDQLEHQLPIKRNKLL